MKKNKPNNKKLPPYVKNYQVTRPGDGIVPICHICKKVALAAKLDKKNRVIIWWCDHGRCNKDRPKKELIERFENKLCR